MIMTQISEPYRSHQNEQYQLLNLYAQASGMQSISQSLLIRLIEELKNIDDISNLQKVIKRYSSLLRHQPSTLTSSEFFRNHVLNKKMEKEITEQNAVVNSLQSQIIKFEQELSSILNKYKNNEEDTLEKQTQLDFNKYTKSNGIPIQTFQENLFQQLSDFLYERNQEVKNIHRQIINLKKDCYSLIESNRNSNEEDDEFGDSILDGLKLNIEHIRQLIYEVKAKTSQLDSQSREQKLERERLVKENHSLRMTIAYFENEQQKTQQDGVKNMCSEPMAQMEQIDLMNSQIAQYVGKVKTSNQHLNELILQAKELHQQFEQFTPISRTSVACEKVKSVIQNSRTSLDSLKSKIQTPKGRNTYTYGISPTNSLMSPKIQRQLSVVEKSKRSQSQVQLISTISRVTMKKILDDSETESEEYHANIQDGSQQ